jgi:hypothetical protein
MNSWSKNSCHGTPGGFPGFGQRRILLQLDLVLCKTAKGRLAEPPQGLFWTRKSRAGSLNEKVSPDGRIIFNICADH